jgi:hypothetical protein
MEPILGGISEGAESSVRQVWNLEIGNEQEAWYKLQDAVLDDSGRIVLAVTANFTREGGNPYNDLEIYIVETSGNVLARIPIDKDEIHPGDSQGGTISENVFVAALNRNRVLIVGNLFEGEVSAVSLDIKEKRVVDSKLLKSTKGPMRVQAVCRNGSSSFVALGADGTDCRAMGFDQAGTVNWEIVDDRGATDFFVDCTDRKKLGSLFTANSGNYNLLGVGESHLIIGRFDSAQRQTELAKLPGRDGSIADCPDHGFVVAYDASSDMGQDIRVVKYDDRGVEKWQHELFSISRSIRRDCPRAYSDSDGNVVVVGGRAGQPYAVCLDSDGKKKWTYSASTQNPCSDFRAIVDRQLVYLLSTMTDIEKGRSTVHVSQLNPVD